MAELILAQRIIKQLKSFDAPGDLIEMLPCDADSRGPSLQSDQRRNHLQIIPDAVLNLLQRRVLIAQLAFEIRIGVLGVCANEDERHQPEDLIAVVILDGRHSPARGLGARS
jgi:hypothetical protein